MKKQPIQIKLQFMKSGKNIEVSAWSSQEIVSFAGGSSEGHRHLVEHDGIAMLNLDCLGPSVMEFSYVHPVKLSAFANIVGDLFGFQQRQNCVERFAHDLRGKL